MTEWIRKRTFEGTENDWTVLRDGLVVGRVYLDVSQNGFRAERWFWATMTIPACSGYSETMAAGLEQVRSLATAKWSHAPHGWPIKLRLPSVWDRLTNGINPFASRFVIVFLISNSI